LAAADPEAYVASAYDDPLVIEGNASLGDEIAQRTPDAVIAPVGGGGLAAGIFIGARRSGAPIELLGAEPLLANDGARSWRSGQLVVQDYEPPTIADGARTLSLGLHNWGVLRGGFNDVLEVDEEAIKAGVRWLAAYAGLRAEPTGALAIAAFLANPQRFAGKRVVCVVSGGNVDDAVYDAIMAEG
jgi:threonine dehydratase